MKQAQPESSLNYNGVYTCPVCRYGQISALTLTEAYACNFCHHIFTADLEKQVVRVADSSQPMSWRWTGKNWRSAQHRDGELTVAIWLMAIALIILPTFLVWLSAHLFPPEPGSKGAWIPNLWMNLTLISHLAFVSWLLAQVYQFPIFTMLRVRLRRWFVR
jgi:Protein of unknown function (DUF2396)